MTLSANELRTMATQAYQSTRWQTRMAAELCVSPRTVANWSAKGVSRAAEADRVRAHLIRMGAGTQSEDDEAKLLTAMHGDIVKLKECVERLMRNRMKRGDARREPAERGEAVKPSTPTQPRSKLMQLLMHTKDTMEALPPAAQRSVNQALFAWAGVTDQAWIEEQMRADPDFTPAYSGFYSAELARDRKLHGMVTAFAAGQRGLVPTLDVAKCLARYGELEYDDREIEALLYVAFTHELVHQGVRIAVQGDSLSITDAPAKQQNA